MARETDRQRTSAIVPGGRERRRAAWPWVVIGCVALSALVIALLTVRGRSGVDADYVSVPILIGALALASLLNRRTGLVVAVLAGGIAAIVPGSPTSASETGAELAARLLFLVAMSVAFYRVIALLRDREEHLQRQLDTVRALAAEMTTLHALTTRVPTDRAAVERQILAAALRLSHGTRGALHLRDSAGDDGWRAVRLAVPPDAPHTGTRGAITAPLVSGRDVIGILEIEPGGARSRDEAQILAVYARDAALTLAHLTLQEEVERLAVAGERGRIARDLHDGLVQSLAGIAFRLEHYRDHLGPEDGTVRAGLAATATEVKEALREARAMIHGLRDIPGATTLREVVAVVTRRAAFTVAMEAPATDPPLTPSGRETLYKVAREALQNIIKHADATHVCVRLTRVGDRCTLAIVDDGCGFANGAANPSGSAGGFGIRGMEERARAAGGTLTIAARPGGGTRVTLTLPLEGAAGDDPYPAR